MLAFSIYHPFIAYCVDRPWLGARRPALGLARPGCCTWHPVGMGTSLVVGALRPIWPLPARAVLRRTYSPDQRLPIAHTSLSC